VNADDFLAPDKYGFRKRCVTCDAIAELRVMCDISLEDNNKVHICYVDFEKAFDRINWVKLVAILAYIGVDWRHISLIKEWYINQKAFFMDKKILLTEKLNCEQKKQIIKSTVWNVALYAAET